jgi:outer membrane PBP1 activator LpoA protein
MLAQRGDHLAAAQAYLTLVAQTSDVRQRHKYQMEAAELLLRAKRVGEAKRQFTALYSSQDTMIRQRLVLAQAEASVLENQGQKALGYLNILAKGLERSLHVRYYEIQARALELQQRYVEAAQSRIKLSALLSNQADQKANRQYILQDLMQASTDQLIPPANADASWKGWLALAQLMQRTHPQYRQQALEYWQSQYPNHPAAGDLGLRVNGLNQPDATTTPAEPPAGYQGFKPHVALLLPMSGKLARHAKAVRDGFFATWYAEGQDRVAVRVYDTDSDNVVQLYNKALQSGANIVVGPLDKSRVTELAQAINAQAAAPVPTVTLNMVESNQLATLSNLPRFYQFSLAPEDEAREVAIWAWEDGHRTAATLVPQGEWGQRLQQAFITQWQNLGGQVVESQSYNKNNIASPVRSIASHRGYLNMVFVAAYPNNARRIKPQFRFALADPRRGTLGPNIPLYATSHVYSGASAPNLDRDLNHVRFVEIPWRIKGMDEASMIASSMAGDLYPSLRSQWPNRYSNRLLALGIDAFRLTQRLNQFVPGRVLLNGETGRLSMSQQGTIHRNLHRAWFKNGLARALDGYSAPITPETTPSADYRPGYQ